MNGKLKPFERGYLEPQTWEEFKATWGFTIEKFNITEEGLRNQYDFITHGQEIWMNDEYQVNIDKNAKGFGDKLTIWHLSIKRLDKETIHDWRDLQAIKNMLVGEQYEAIELYPSEDRIVDTANQYHLWVFYHIDGEDNPPRIPIGWTQRMISEEDLVNGKQRKF